PVLLDDAITPARLARWDNIEDQYGARKHAMSAKGRSDNVYKPVQPELLYLNDADWDAALAAHRVVQLTALPQATGFGATDAGGRMGRNFAPERQQENVSLFGALKDHIQAKMSQGPVRLASYSEGARDRMEGLLGDEGLIGPATITSAARLGKTGLYQAVWGLAAGFEGPWNAAHLSVIAEQDILGD